MSNIDCKILCFGWQIQNLYNTCLMSLFKSKYGIKEIFVGLDYIIIISEKYGKILIYKNEDYTGAISNLVKDYLTMRNQRVINCISKYLGYSIKYRNTICHYYNTKRGIMLESDLFEINWKNFRVSYIHNRTTNII